MLGSSKKQHIKHKLEELNDSLDRCQRIFESAKNCNMTSTKVTDKSGNIVMSRAEQDIKISLKIQNTKDKINELYYKNF